MLDKYIFIYQYKSTGGKKIEYQQLSKIYFERNNDGTKQREDFGRTAEAMFFTI